MELKRVLGTCCPEPTCDYVRTKYVACEGCGASCLECPFNPNKELTDRNKKITKK